MSNLAIFGGEKAVKTVNPEMTKWPIITEEEEVAIPLCLWLFNIGI